MAAGGRFHARGLHPTGVCGVFGATVSAARLRGLDEARRRTRSGSPGSMAGGLLEFLADGAKTKPLHPGWAAHAAVTAARLAAHGATGPATVLDGRRGFFATYLHGETPDLDGAARRPRRALRDAADRVQAVPGVPLHARAGRRAGGADRARGADGRRRRGRSRRCPTRPGVGLVLHPLADKLAPRTAYDSKFSLPYCLAALLVRGSVDVSSFSRSAIGDPAVLSRAARVDYEQRDYAASPDAFPGGVRVRTRDGRVLEEELRHQRGGTENPMSVAEIVGKFRANAAQALRRRGGVRARGRRARARDAGDARAVRGAGGRRRDSRAPGLSGGGRLPPSAQLPPVVGRPRTAVPPPGRIVARRRAVALPSADSSWYRARGSTAGVCMQAAA